MIRFDPPPKRGTTGKFRISIGDSALELDDVDHALVFSHISRFWKKLIHIDCVESLEMRRNGMLRNLKKSDLTDRFFSHIPFEYKASNNILRPICGPNFPSLYIFPSNNSIFVAINNKSFEISSDQFISSIEKYCNEVAAKLPESTHQLAKGIWEKRWDDSVVNYSQCYNTSSETVIFFNEKNIRNEFAVPFLLAARSTSNVVSPDELREIENIILNGGCPPSQTFHSTKSEVQKLAKLYDAPLAYEVGYSSAKKFREFSLGSGEIYPEKICAEFSIPIHTLSLSSAIDGFSFVSNNNCGIIVNSKGIHSNSVQGKKFTLLHELGHLLLEFVDFSRGAFEVKSKSNSSIFEKICNAFAAEVLIPQGELEVISQFAKYDLGHIYERASREFGVGSTVVTFQIINNSQIYDSLNQRDKANIDRVKNKISNYNAI